MAKIVDDISRTFGEFLILPGLSTHEHIPGNVQLRVPLRKTKLGSTRLSDAEKPVLKIPFVAASMQAVTGTRLAIALARKGGCGFIFCSQSVESQAEMVRAVKEHKAGFVEPDTNLPPTATLQDVVALTKTTGHSTIAVTADGEKNSKLFGILTAKDFWEFKDDLSRPVVEFYTPVERLVYAEEGVSLQEATEILWKAKKACLPVVDKQGNLKSLVFRRDYFDHKSNPDELTDDKKRLYVGAAINTHDYRTRVPALVAAGVDCLCVDSSDGHSEWQADAITFVKQTYGDSVTIGAGNIVTAEGFDFLVRAGADFVKVGIGGGSICITREQKGIGRGQASAVMEVAEARDEYFRKTGWYVPICSDGGLNTDTHIIVALALGADFVMMGKYFAMTEESPGERITYRGRLYKPYWGEGSSRAKNWERYKQSDGAGMIFEEGVDAYVPYSGTLTEKVDITLAKIRSTLCNTGTLDIGELHQRVVLTRVSELTLIEGGTSTVEQLDRISIEHRS